MNDGDLPGRRVGASGWNWRSRTARRAATAAVCAAALLTALWCLGSDTLVQDADAQAPPTPTLETKTPGLRWRFVRLRYSAHNTDSFRARYWSDPWAVDGPAAEQNLSRRLKTVTSIEVDDPIVLTLEDPEIWNNPWIYIVEPGSLRLTEAEVPILREFLLRGGTAVLDDFHGPIEWDNVISEFKRVFPDREIVELEPEHPIYHCFYQLDGYPQVPGLGSFMQGRTWEKQGFTAHLRGIEDDRGRAMVLINWNTDMGDGVEWSNVEEYPGYVVHTAQAYRMMINEIVYSLTH